MGDLLRPSAIEKDKLFPADSLRTTYSPIPPPPHHPITPVYLSSSKMRIAAKIFLLENKKKIYIIVWLHQ
jgi:hypothetical protein